MRVLVEISYDDEIPVGKDETWVDAIEVATAEVVASLSGLLHSNTGKRGPIHVSVKPR